MNFDAVWPTILRVYKEDGVEAACLALQEDAGVDIAFLLTVLAWARLGNRAFKLAEIARLDSGVRAWRETVVKPIRSARQSSKKLAAPALNEFRASLKQVELSAEKAEINLVLDSLQAFPGETDNRGEGAVYKTACSVIQYFEELKRGQAGLSEQNRERGRSIAEKFG